MSSVFKYPQLWNTKLFGTPTHLHVSIVPVLSNKLYLGNSCFFFFNLTTWILSHSSIKYVETLDTWILWQNFRKDKSSRKLDIIRSSVYLWRRLKLVRLSSLLWDLKNFEDCILFSEIFWRLIFMFACKEWQRNNSKRSETKKLPKYFKWLWLKYQFKTFCNISENQKQLSFSFRFSVFVIALLNVRRWKKSVRKVKSFKIKVG